MQAIQDTLQDNPLLGTAAVIAAGVFGGPWAALGASVLVAAIAKPKRPQEPGFSNTPTPFSTRQPIAPWQVVFGQTRVGGVLTYRNISAERRFWHMVITFACHRCEAVDEVWFNDEKLAIDADGNVLGKYAKTPAGVTPVVFEGTIPAIAPHEVTIPDTVAGVKSVVVEIAPGVGRTFFETGDASPSGLAYFRPAPNVFRFASGNGGRKVSITYNRAVDTVSWARVKISLGNEGPTTQPFPDLVAETAGRKHKWTQDHLQYGHTKLYIRLEANREVFPGGVPNVTVVLRGARVLDPRTGLTAYSNNAALCINHYLTEAALGYGLGAAYATEVHNADMIAAANSSDDPFTIAAGGTEKRYAVNGAFLVSETPKAILGQLLAACAGTLVNQGDKWHISVGVYYPPTVTLDERHVAGPSEIVPLLPSREDGNANGVKGVFTNPQKNWQSDDFAPIASDTYLADDNGERRWKDIDLGRFVTSHSQAQRLAKIDLLRLRQGLIEKGPFKLQAWQVVPGRTVARTDSQLGWTAKAFEVLESELAIVDGGDGNVILQAMLTNRETAAAIYDWNTSEEQLDDLAPNTELPDPGFVPPPGAPVLDEQKLVTHDGRSVVTKATISWLASIYPFGPRYQLEYKLTAASVYTVLPLTTGTKLEIPDIAPGVYDFRVKATSLSGASSAYAASLIEIIGLVADPADVAGFFVTVHEGRARCHLDLAPDLDVRIGGRLWIRWSPLSVGAAWNDGSLIKMDGYAGDSIVVEGPLYGGTYMAKYEDSTGHFSRNEAKFVVTEALLTGFTTLNTVTFHPAFDGVKVNVAAPDGFLQLTGTQLWDSMPGNIDDWDRIDSLGGIASSGSCTFSTKQDLGSVKTVRLVPSIRTLAFDTGDLWDSRTTLMDDWGLIDGSVIEDAEIVPQVRITSDDPNGGSPTWGPWHNLEVADYTARGFEYRTLHSSENVTHNRRLEQFSVAAKQPA